ncbi:DUF2905 domain-containing protein [Deinococcus peraridilitoris]|uniref:DUF2905 domain-containing protein n=1 Tax=Deinococcus peraridilitoris (strain DSM 19664 / LMG 22246 / CIP 109416 / KR-200) TaxID=937777 RepID=K9ZXG7_DEIPD|nr:DUF2905 domain-containing protein [Deinococcus peraridilitoris]AFZ66276.1 Protein of unknown function (DUF2905) [Deinococcus peraridilitoris DSM 19664]
MSGPKVLILIGLALTVLGVVWLASPQTFPKLFSWFGRLPGDIRIHNENASVFIPLTSMIVVSVALSLLFRLFK